MFRKDIMKKFNYLIFTFLGFVCFILTSSATTLYGGLIPSNDDRDYKGLNVIEEIDNDTAFGQALIDYSSDFKTFYLNSLNSAISSTSSINFGGYFSIGAFNLYELSLIKNGSHSLTIPDNTSYALFNYCSLTVKSNTLYFRECQLSYKMYFVYFDSDMNVLGYDSYYSDGDVYMVYSPLSSKVHDVWDFTGFLSILLYSNEVNGYGSADFLSSTYDKFIINYFYDDGYMKQISNSSISVWAYSSLGFAKLFSSDISYSYSEGSNTSFNILDNDYYNSALINFSSSSSKSSDAVHFISATTFDGSDITLPSNYSTIYFSNFDDGFYLVPKSSSSCDVDDYLLYYYSNFSREAYLYYSVITPSYEILNTYSFTAPTVYKLYSLNVIEGTVITIDNVNDYTYYFYLSNSAADVTFAYNSDCFSIVEASQNSSVSSSITNSTTGEVWKFSSSLTSALKDTTSDTYALYTSSEDDYVNSTTYNGSYSSLSVSDIVSNSYNSISGLFSSIQVCLGIMTTFLTSLPTVVYSTIIFGFTMLIIIGILKMFL